MIPNWIPIVLSLVAILVAIASYLATRREKRYDIFLSLWQEYSSREMLACLQALYQLWFDKRGSSEQIVKEYVARYESGDLELHYQRRVVSFLFQKLAFLYYHNLIPREFRKEWLGFSLEVIAILKPIELMAMPEILKNQPPFPASLDLHEIGSKDFRRMFRLYNEARNKSNPPEELS
jgi:hypothetical protein